MTARTMTFQIPAELARTEAIAKAQPDRHAPLRQVAQSLSRRGVAAAKVELCNLALVEFATALFDQDADGITPNVDADGRIIIPAPWGRNGGPLWGLRRTEQRALNHIMRQRSITQNAPLFVYDADSRAWLLGRSATLRSSMTYLRNLPVTLAEWRQAWDAVRSTWARQNLGD